MNDLFKDIPEGTLIAIPEGEVMFLRVDQLPSGKFNPKTRVFKHCMYRMFYKRKDGSKGHIDIDVSE